MGLLSPWACPLPPLLLVQRLLSPQAWLALPSLGRLFCLCFASACWAPPAGWVQLVELQTRHCPAGPTAHPGAPSAWSLPGLGPPGRWETHQSLCVRTGHHRPHDARPGPQLSRGTGQPRWNLCERSVSRRSFFEMVPSHRSPVVSLRPGLVGPHSTPGERGGSETGFERTQWIVGVKAESPWSLSETQKSGIGAGLGCHSTPGKGAFSGLEALVEAVGHSMPQRACAVGAGPRPEAEPGSEGKTAVRKLFLRGFGSH